MSHMENKPYEGSEPYAFVSYSHNDASEILPILEALNQRGYRIWFDEGIIPGTEWPERIGEHLLNSEVFLAFLSPNSMDSINCRREINLALKDPNKKFVCVFLKDTDLTPGMQLQLESQRNLYRQNFTDEESFLQAICSANGMRNCRKVPAHVARENREELPDETKSPEEDNPVQENRAGKASRRKIIIGIVMLLILMIMVFFAFLSREKEMTREKPVVSTPAAITVEEQTDQETAETPSVQDTTETEEKQDDTQTQTELDTAKTQTDPNTTEPPTEQDTAEVPNNQNNEETSPEQNSVETQPKAEENSSEDVEQNSPKPEK